MKRRSRKYRAAHSSGNNYKLAIRVKYRDEQRNKKEFYITFYKDMSTCVLEREKLASKLQVRK